MEKAKLPTKAREVLGPILQRPGGILYSGHNTLQKGDVYLLGFNPGGRAEDGSPIVESLDTMLTNERNAYLCENWLTDDENNKDLWGKAPLQQRLQWVAGQLGINLEDICASNLIFVKSRKAGEVPYVLAKMCWPVHQEILDIVQPKLILAFGNSRTSPYGYLKTKFGKDAIEASEAAGHGRWQLRRFRATINGHPTVVAGLPHLSRYSPGGKDHVSKWLRDSLNGAF